MHVISGIGLEGEAMSKEEFKRERLYLVSLSVAKSMLRKGVISEERYKQVDMALQEKYRPVLGMLLSGRPL